MERYSGEYHPILWTYILRRAYEGEKGGHLLLLVRHNEHAYVQDLLDSMLSNGRQLWCQYGKPC